jgi:hypothetical protein
MLVLITGGVYRPIDCQEWVRELCTMNEEACVSVKEKLS